MLDGALRHHRGERREGRYLGGQRHCLVHQAVVRDEPLEQAHAQRLFGLDGPAAENQIEGVACAHDARKEVRHPCVRGERAFDEDRLETRVFGAEADIAGQGEGHSGACRHAVHCRDRGLINEVDGPRLAADPAVFVHHLLPGELLFGRWPRAGEVGAAAEAAPGACPDHGTHIVAALQLGADLKQLQLETAVQRVQLFGSVEGDGRNVVCDFQNEVFVGHGDLPACSRAS